MELIPEYYKTQEMYGKSIDTCPFVFHSVPDWCKTQEICDEAISNGDFMLKYSSIDIKPKKFVIKKLIIFYKY